ncbi:MAG: hypothetical protein JW963_02375 [Anaerolineales bacterium]|nr:hypothetical protein [Anaerolineales bacterium]
MRSVSITLTDYGFTGQRTEASLGGAEGLYDYNARFYDVDYPEGEKCPHCPFWTHRDRWTGEAINCVDDQEKAPRNKQLKRSQDE